MSPWQLRLAKKMIDRGAIIAYPTEAVYGLGCDPMNAQAVIKLCNLKQRDIGKGLILIASKRSQLEAYTCLDAKQWSTIEGAQAKPTTWVVPASKSCPVWLRGMHNSIAIRLTHFHHARHLCDAVGQALVSTSANISQHEAARNALSVQRIFADQVDLILHADTGGATKPSEIRDIGSREIIRSG